MDLITAINGILTANNALLQRKINDPYSPIVDEELTEIVEAITALEEALRKLEEERKTHNSKVVRTQPIVEALTSINNQIAYYDVIEFSRQHDIQENEMAGAKKAYDDAVADRNAKKNTLEDLNGRRKSINIAIDLINNGLKYIFFAENSFTKIKRYEEVV